MVKVDDLFNGIEALKAYLTTESVTEKNALVADVFLRAVSRCAEEAESIGLSHLAVWCFPPDETDSRDHRRRLSAITSLLRTEGYSFTPFQTYPTDEDRFFRSVVRLQKNESALLKSADHIARKCFEGAIPLPSPHEAYGFSHIRMPGLSSVELQAEPLLAHIYACFPAWWGGDERHRTRLDPQYAPLENAVVHRIKELAPELIESRGAAWRLVDGKRLDVMVFPKAPSYSRRRSLIQEGWQGI